MIDPSPGVPTEDGEWANRLGRAAWLRSRSSVLAAGVSNGYLAPDDDFSGWTCGPATAVL